MMFIINFVKSERGPMNRSTKILGVGDPYFVAHMLGPHVRRPTSGVTCMCHLVLFPVIDIIILLFALTFTLGNHS